MVTLHFFFAKITLKFGKSNVVRMFYNILPAGGADGKRVGKRGVETSWIFDFQIKRRTFAVRLYPKISVELCRTCAFGRANVRGMVSVISF